MNELKANIPVRFTEECINEINHIFTEHKRIAGKDLEWVGHCLYKLNKPLEEFESVADVEILICHIYPSVIGSHTFVGTGVDNTLPILYNAFTEEGWGKAMNLGYYVGNCQGTEIKVPILS